ncbi:chemotaxis protein MotA [Jannaschia faecimaris]|uniref:Chemotaxis protein MotA n=1 Tax=Jannaschia faecimaris TaxID=1244108 RepID=A0A1H3JYX3_9RHOB|nr:flagellar motor stator protein MotA [Jannaschia faecimaris]SDY44715.1 chemotaxis protein MotA [Jannaschia faecimaris]
MVSIAGLACIFIMIFGGYLMAGGKMGIILKSLPFEMMMIGGAASGIFLVSNSMSEVKRTIKDIKKVFNGAHWKPDDYRDLLCLLFELIRLGRQNAVALEEHIENPMDSAIFTSYSKILLDREAVAMICDTLRAVSMNYDDPNQVQDVLGNRLDENLHHSMHSSRALQSMADALPALGIVAAVLGVIKTMASIDQPPEILGKLIGGALVGTFLGVFLSYGIVGPFAMRLKAVCEQDSNFYGLIQDVLVANLQNHPTNICIEVGRQSTPSDIRPSYSDLEKALKIRKAA